MVFVSPHSRSKHIFSCRAYWKLGKWWWISEWKHFALMSTCFPGLSWRLTKWIWLPSTLTTCSTHSFAILHTSNLMSEIRLKQETYINVVLSPSCRSQVPPISNRLMLMLSISSILLMSSLPWITLKTTLEEWSQRSFDFSPFYWCYHACDGCESQEVWQLPKKHLR